MAYNHAGDDVRNYIYFSQLLDYVNSLYVDNSWKNV